MMKRAVRYSIRSLVLLVSAAPLQAAETLYNGITLPDVWPPKIELTREPMAVPYLAAPPAVISIDVGRQLFVDDFLIEQTTLKRVQHLTTWHPATPVLKPDQPWEQEGGATAAPFSDGVWFDPQDQLFKLWYLGGYLQGTCLATSKDGIHWDKPKLDVVPGTNIVMKARRDSNTVWLDHTAKDPQQRFKMMVYDFKKGIALHASPDGIHWGSEIVRYPQTGDRSTSFFNAFRNVWVHGIRADYKGLGRTRRYLERADFFNVGPGSGGDPVWWVGADQLDPIRDDLKTPCQLYNLDCVAYESVMLGLFDIWRGQPKDRAKPNELCVGYSRDGFHWSRPARRAFIPVSEHHGDWNWGNVQSAGGCCLVVGDQLWFYVSGRAGVPGSTTSGTISTGLAVLRRDGFTSMDAGDEEQTLTTRPVTFSGKHLFVNLAAAKGELRVEVLDPEGHVIAPFTKENCEPLSLDKTLAPIRWKGAADLSKLSGKPVKFRFHLKRGALYAFWVSDSERGASHGYVGAGGPGFTAGVDR